MYDNFTAFTALYYAESSSSSSSANPQVPSVSVVPPLVIRVRPESPRVVPAAGRSSFVRPPSRSQAGSVVPPVAGRSGPVRPAARNQAGVGVPLRVPAGGRSGPFVVESFVRPSSPVRSAFRPFVSTVVPQPPPTSPSERGQSVGSMPALVPIWPPTLVAGRSSDDGFRSPLVSSQGSSSLAEPYDFETQHSLEANYLATLLTSKYSIFSIFFFFFLLFSSLLIVYIPLIKILFFLLTSGYTTQERIAGYYTFRRDMDAHLSTLDQDDQYRLLPPHRDNWLFFFSLAETLHVLCCLPIIKDFLSDSLRFVILLFLFDKFLRSRGTSDYLFIVRKENS
jgi:hypothetical protein